MVCRDVARVMPARIAREIGERRCRQRFTEPAAAGGYTPILRDV